MTARMRVMLGLYPEGSGGLNLSFSFPDKISNLDLQARHKPDLVLIRSSTRAGLRAPSTIRNDRCRSSSAAALQTRL